MLHRLIFLSLFPLVFPRGSTVDTGNSGLPIDACSPPWCKATPVYICSALGTAPDGVVEAVNFFIADGTLVGKGLASTGVGAR